MKDSGGIVIVFETQEHADKYLNNFVKPRNVSYEVVEYEHQGSRRVERGFVLLPPLWFIMAALAGTFIEFGVMIYDIGSRMVSHAERWF